MMQTDTTFTFLNLDKERASDKRYIVLLLTIFLNLLQFVPKLLYYFHYLLFLLFVYPILQERRGDVRIV